MRWLPGTNTFTGSPALGLAGGSATVLPGAELPGVVLRSGTFRHDRAQRAGEGRDRQGEMVTARAVTVGMTGYPRRRPSAAHLCHRHSHGEANGGHPMGLPPTTWRCRCDTEFPESAPTLKTSR